MCDTVKSNANHVEGTGIKMQRVRWRKGAAGNYCNERAIRFTFVERYKVSQERYRVRRVRRKVATAQLAFVFHERC